MGTNFYIIKRIDDGKYVAAQGSKSSYTTNIAKARRFAVRDDAVRDCCGNERVVSIEEALNNEG